MSKYTLELRYLADNPFNEIFDFQYDFYEETHKTEFQRKFIEHYYFDEIAFPTIDMFKHRLKAKLDLIAPYYKQLYNTELEASKCNFMLNKDLKETFLREIENTSTSNAVNENTSNSNSTSSSTGIGSDTPQGQILDIEEYMTTASKTDGDVKATTTDNSVATGNSSNTGMEKTELISQGNIGITSSGSLLEDWRKVLINIDELIINECLELFLMVY